MFQALTRNLNVMDQWLNYCISSHDLIKCKTEQSRNKIGADTHLCASILRHEEDAPFWKQNTTNYFASICVRDIRKRFKRWFGKKITIAKCLWQVEKKFYRLVMTSSTLKSLLQSDSKYKLMVVEIEIRKVSKYLVLQSKKVFKELLALEGNGTDIL